MGLQAAYRNNTVRSIVSDESVELDRSPLEQVCAVSRLRKLPPGPYRSLGGYLNYAGWPDCERFIELDSSLRRQAKERDADEQRRCRAGAKNSQTGDPFADLIRGWE